MINIYFIFLGGKIGRPHGFVYKKIEAKISCLLNLIENILNYKFKFAIHKCKTVMLWMKMRLINGKLKNRVFLSICLYVLKHAITTEDVKQGVMTF